MTNLAKTDCAVPRGQPRVEKWLGGLLQRCLLGSNLLGRSWGCSWGGSFPRAAPVPVPLNERGTRGFETQLCSFEPCSGSSQHSWCPEQQEWALLLLLAIRLLLHVSLSARGLAGQPWGHSVIWGP